MSAVEALCVAEHCRPAVLTQGRHLLGYGMRWESPHNRLYDEEGFEALIQHVDGTIGTGSGKTKISPQGCTRAAFFCVRGER